MPPQRRHANDFWGDNNDTWLANTEIPDTETRITQAYFIRKTINTELDTIVRSAVHEGANPIADLVTSWKASEAHEVPPGLTPLLMLMLSTNGPSDISSRIGWMNRYGISSPISLYVQGDPRDHSRCRIVIEEGSPRIGIPEYWTWPTYVGHRKAYATYVKSLAATLGLPALLKGYEAEREFSQVFPLAGQRKKRINMLNWRELCAKYTTIDWPAMMTAWGLQESELSRYMYNVTSQPFFHHLQRRMNPDVWSAERWQGWLALLVAQWCAGMSPHGPLRRAWFTYTRRYLQGMIADDPPQELRYAVVRTLLPNTLGKLWVAAYCPPTLRKAIGDMVVQIQTAAAAALHATSWMAPKTRAAAVRKLKAMDIQVCWPTDWENHEPDCSLQTTDIISNVLAIASVETQAQFTLLRSGNCRKPSGNGWSRPVFEVNAFYYPDENRFLLPAAILRPPFYDPAKSVAWNYGAIGATIGHEFCHAFDADGRQNDEKGDARDWWTDADDREYRKRAAAVVKLYESVPYRGLEVDGKLTLVENIADLGGLEFAIAGLRGALGREATKAELREFFTAYAVSWRSKDRLKRAAELIATDPHAPPRLRVNHAVRQMDEWYTAFDIQPDAEGYVPPAKRIHFFA